MRVSCLGRNDRIYSSNVYLLLGDWSRIGDVNALIDVGADPAVLPFVERAPTGVGKRKVDLVILTHRHYDHALMLPEIKARYGARVLAWGKADDPVDESVADGQRIRVADDEIEVIHTPAHTDDSICLYGVASGVLFAGDTPLLSHSTDGAYTLAFVEALGRIASRPVSAIYFGHGEPLTERCNERLEASLRNVLAAGRLAG
jgi:glyoxylase-like metal-dependent hydrolase (beta-lactamase superfamily II)